MKGYKRIIAAVLVICCAAGLLTACGSSPSPAASPASSTGPTANASKTEPEETAYTGEKITEPIEFTIATCWGTNDSSPNVGLDYIKKVCEELSDGMITVNLAKNTLGAERELFEDVQLGNLEMCVATTGTLAGFVPYADIFMVPYIFKDRNHAFACVDGALGERMDELCLEAGFRVLDWQIVGTRQIYGVGDKVTAPDDLVGKKIRVMETNMLVALYEHYGAIATPMAYSEVYTALQQHAIDGCQAGLPSTSVNHHEVCDWVAILDENITMCPVTASDTWWKSLPKEAQDIITFAVKNATVIVRKIDKAQDELLKPVWEAAGCEVYYADRDAFEAKAREIYPEFKEMLNGDPEGWIDWIVEMGEFFPAENMVTDEMYQGITYDY